MYPWGVPKLWSETIEEHRRAVHDATLDTTAALVREHGLAAVTMSQIAAAAGIGRATLYKYFPDVEAILVAWHERHIARHLRQLTAARDAAGTPAGQLEAVLMAFALIQHEHHDTELPVSLLHRGEHVARARQQLRDLVADLLATGAQAGEIRADIAPGELAGYCLHALTAAGSLPSEAAVRRLLAVTMSGLRPQAAG
jgi:AcrR family transcriptional regulator